MGLTRATLPLLEDMSDYVDESALKDNKVQYWTVDIIVI